MSDKTKDWLHVAFAAVVFLGFLVFCLAWHSIERRFRLQMATIEEAKLSVSDNLRMIKVEQEVGSKHADDLLAARAVNMNAHAATQRYVGDVMKIQVDIRASQSELVTALRDLREEVSKIKVRAETKAGSQVIELRGGRWLEK